MSVENTNSRLETFCDGVFAIAITLLILEIKVPPVASVHSIPEFWHEIFSDWPSWFGFLLSFIIILVAWHNHHNVFKFLDKSSSSFIYANGFLLLTVTVYPFTSGLMAEYMLTEYAQPAMSLYCFNNFVHSIGWFLLLRYALHPKPLTKSEKGRVELEAEIVKANKFAVLLYLVFFILSFWIPFVSMILMTASWILWIVMSVRLDTKT